MTPTRGRIAPVKPLHFVTVCGSLRSGSFNAALLRVAEAELVRLGGTFDRYDEIREIPPYDEDLDTDPPPLISELRAAVAASDGVLSASPAYNGAITGALKDWVDWMSRPFGHCALGGKHVGINTASIGLQVVTDDDHRERGLDSFLTRTVLDTIAATEGGLVIPSCPFVASYIDPRAQYQSLVAV